MQTIKFRNSSMIIIDIGTYFHLNSTIEYPSIKYTFIFSSKIMKNSLYYDKIHNSRLESTHLGKWSRLTSEIIIKAQKQRLGEIRTSK